MFLLSKLVNIVFVINVVFILFTFWNLSQSWNVNIFLSANLYFSNTSSGTGGRINLMTLRVSSVEVNKRFLVT
jgi:hypothetical protein